MDKAPDAYRTISEVGEDLDLPQHVLRFWETRFAQIKPLKRGGGRRYYRPDDVELLKGIRHLLYKEGYTIKGVQRILKEQGARAVMAWARPVEEMEAFETPAQPYFAPQPEFAAQTLDPPPLATAPAAPAVVAPAPQIYASAPAAPVMAAPMPQAYATAPAAPAVAAPMPQAYAVPPEAPPPWQEAQPEDPRPSPAAPREVEPSPPMAIATGQVSMFRGGLRRLEGQLAPAPTPGHGVSRVDPAPPAVQQAALPAAPAAGERGRAQLIEALQALNETRAVLDQLLALRCDPLP